MVHDDIHEPPHEPVRRDKDIGDFLDGRGANIAAISPQLGQQEVVIGQIEHPDHRRANRIEHHNAGHSDQGKAPDADVIQKEQGDDDE